MLSFIPLLKTTRDVCFRGNLFPGLVFLPDPSVWHWHIIGQNLSVGTECVFSADVEDAYFRDFVKLNSSCKVKGM